MKTYCIYKATNKINGKVYIGKTKNFKKRKYDHIKKDVDNHLIFHKALKKYGDINFNWEIIDWADTKEEINELEKYYIKKFNSFKPNGYNMTKGGDGGSMYNARPIVCLTFSGKFLKRYESAAEAERQDGFYNSDVLVSCKNQNRTCKGYIFMFEDDYIKNGPRIYEKPKSTCVKSIIQCDLNGNFIKEYESVTQSSLKTGILRTRISAALIGKSKTAGGFIFVYKENFPIKNIEQYVQNKKGRKIIQVNPDTNQYIKEYERISDAGKELGVNYKSIHKVLDLPGRTAYGYKWISK